MASENQTDIEGLEQRVAALEAALEQRVAATETALGQRVHNLEQGVAHLAYHSEFVQARENLRQAGRKMDLRDLAAAVVDFADALIAATKPEVLLGNKE